ncbi:hypothetical protein D8Y22_06880 [Salinadaptatus halalkaliphilus]|uniref:DUF7827 domain-containing protein n=1 Tax=Salinadaptatus halalkaliphilus TaxID=2419781 RepID=A0A4S3TMP0_9EURY|nr:BGTF surface domain-containing protein [Salinadaptatus halalkaliphilus]THE65534.1 hypothetical protein D8Y22_06880 [Salinadaptatus halalkaliphilus]
MTPNRTYRESGRALVLATIVILSVVATATAFAGAATTTNDVTYTVDGEESSLLYQGQTVVVSGDFRDTAAYDLRQVTASSGGTVQSSTYVETVTTDGTGQIELETSDLAVGQYYLAEPGDTSPVTVGDTFEVTIQTIRTALEADAVANAGPDATTALDIVSNRGSYSLNVSADGDIDAEELLAIFGDEGEYGDLQPHTAADLDGDTVGAFDAGVYDESEADADEKIVLVDVDDRKAELDFTGVDDDAYDLAFEVVDSTAVDTTAVDVGEIDLDASFDQHHYTQSAGDIVEFTVDLEDTDDAYVQFGDENAGYVDVLYLADDTGSGDVTVQVNTRTAGAPGTSTADAFYAGDDVVQSLVHDGGDEVEQAAFYDRESDSSAELEGGFSEYLEELDLLSDGDEPDDQLTRPLQPTAYDLTVSATGTFVVDDGESDTDDELDRATLDLTPPSVDAVTTSVASSDRADRHDRDELHEFAIERTEIAEGDRLIVDVDASGLVGAVLAAGGDWDALEDGFAADSLSELTANDGEGVSFQVDAADPIGNQGPTSLVLEDADTEAVSVFADTETGVLSVVVDTSSSSAFDGSLEDGMEFTATLAYETDDDERYAFGDEAFDGGAAGEAEPAYPYADADSDEAVSTEFSLVEPTVSFDDRDANDAVALEASETVVTGETTIAPGTVAEVRLEHTDGSDEVFLQTAATTVGADGDFETEPVDLRDREVDGDGTLAFRVDGDTIDEADGVFVEAMADGGERLAEPDDGLLVADDEPVESGDD